MNFQLAILIPVYNNLIGLIDTIKSFQEEDLQGFIFYILDDGSREIITPELVQSHLDDRVNLKIIRNKVNVGIEKSLRRGVEEIARDEIPFFARIDAGDYALKDRLKKQLNILKSSESIALVTSFVELASEQDKDKVKLYLPNLKRLSYTNVIVHSSVMLRTKSVILVGNYNQLAKRVEDYDLWLRLHKAGWEMTCIDEPLTKYVYSEKGITALNSRQMRKQRLKSQCQHFSLFDVWSYFGVFRSVLSLVLKK
ncbi:glycosyltransferase [Cysteiniphilum sp. 6C5]|uniref:glycosyltransferase n=1 Tax=unclassified Cysteiniphilum TaxID=2610889 RepID=UPI003F82CFBC